MRVLDLGRHYDCLPTERKTSERQLTPLTLEKTWKCILVPVRWTKFSLYIENCGMKQEKTVCIPVHIRLTKLFYILITIYRNNSKKYV